MKDKKTKAIMDALMRAFKAKDAKDLESIVRDMENDENGSENNGATHVHIYTGSEKKEGTEGAEDEAGNEGKENKDEGSKEDMILEMLKRICSKLEGTEDDGEGEQEEEGEAGENMDGEEEEYNDKKAKDAASRLEILVPGTKLPVRDAKANPKKFRDTLCNCKRKALDKAYQGDHADVLKPLLQGVDLAKANRATIDALFISSSELVRAKNNSAGARSRVQARDSSKPTSVAELNKKAREAWAARGVN